MILLYGYAVLVLVTCTFGIAVFIRNMHRKRLINRPKKRELARRQKLTQELFDSEPNYMLKPGECYNPLIGEAIRDTQTARMDRYTTPPDRYTTKRTKSNPGGLRYYSGQ